MIKEKKTIVVFFYIMYTVRTIFLEIYGRRHERRCYPDRVFQAAPVRACRIGGTTGPQRGA